MRIKYAGGNFVDSVSAVDFGLSVARGEVPETSVLLISGQNKNITSGATQTLWDQGGSYVWMTSDTQLYVSSSNAGDVGIVVVVTGLDENLEPVTATAVLNGQNQVAVSNLMMWNNVIAVVSGNILLGNIYLAETDTLTGGVPNTASKIKDKIALTGVDAGTEWGSYKISHKANYLVPKDKSVYLLNAVTTADRNARLEDVSGWIMLPNTSVWVQRSPLYVSGEPFLFESLIRTPLAEGTKLEFRARTSTGSSALALQAQLWVVQNSTGANL